MTMIPQDPIGGFPSGDPVGPLPGEAAPAPLPGDVSPLPGDIAPVPPLADVAPDVLPGNAAPAELPGITPSEMPDVIPSETPGDAVPAQSPSAPGKVPSAAPPRAEAPPPQAPTPQAPQAPQAPPWEASTPPGPPGPPPTAPVSGGPSVPGGPPSKPPQSGQQSGQSGNGSPKLSSKGIAAIAIFVLVFILGPNLSRVLDGFGGDSDSSNPPDPGSESVEEELDAEIFFSPQVESEDASLSRVNAWHNTNCATTGISSPTAGCDHGIEAQYQTDEEDLWYRQHVLVFDNPEDARDMFAEIGPDRVTEEVEFRDSGDDDSGFSLTEGEIDATGDYLVITATDVGPEYSGESMERPDTLQRLHEEALANLP